MISILIETCTIAWWIYKSPVEDINFSSFLFLAWILAVMFWKHADTHAVPWRKDISKQLYRVSKANQSKIPEAQTTHIHSTAQKKRAATDHPNCTLGMRATSLQIYADLNQRGFACYCAPFVQWWHTTRFAHFVLLIFHASWRFRSDRSLLPPGLVHEFNR